MNITIELTKGNVQRYAWIIRRTIRDYDYIIAEIEKADEELFPLWKESVKRAHFSDITYESLHRVSKKMRDTKKTLESALKMIIDTNSSSITLTSDEYELLTSECPFEIDKIREAIRDSKRGMIEAMEEYK